MFLSPKIKSTFFAIFIFLASFGLRTYRIDNPVADWHSWRQSDTAAVARNFVKEEFNIFYPKAHNFFKQNPNDLDNPNRYFLNEFPLYNAAVAITYKIFGIKERYARLVSIFASSATAVVLFFLIKKYSSFFVASLSALFFSVLPYNVYYGRVIMPDPTFIFFCVLSLYLTTCWIRKENLVFVIFASLSLALAMLVKPYAIFLGIPIAYLVLKKWGTKSFIRPDVYFMALLSLIPLLAWRYHIHLHPEGMFGSQWLVNATNIRFKGAFFRWIIFERLNKLIFATGGFVLFWLGLAAPRNKKEELFFMMWLASVLAYISYFAMGNVTHDYYQLPLVPIGCYFMAKGVEFLSQQAKNLSQKLINYSLVICLILLMLAFGWYEVRGFFNVNHWEIVKAGKEVDKITPQSAKVIAPYNRDPAFLYQTNRNGWSGLRNMEELEQFMNEGATHYVSVNFDEMTNKLEENCSILKKTEEFVIINLQSCNLNQLTISN